MQRAGFRRLGVIATIVITAFGVVGAAGCSSDDGGSEPSDGGVVPDAAAISIADLTFEPATLPIAAGSTDITITNADSTDHTFTLDDGSVDEPVDAGQTVTVTVEGESGASLPYHCEIHSSMTGALQVA